MRHDLQLNLPKDQRISPLAMSIWRAGVTPWSWVYQMPPDLLPPENEEHIAYGVDGFLRKLDYDEALRLQVAEAEALFNLQGKSLYVDEHGNRIDTPNVTIEDAP